MASTHSADCSVVVVEPCGSDIDPLAEAVSCNYIYYLEHTCEVGEW